jgi:pyruvate dehydrogenase E1 component
VTNEFYGMPPMPDGVEEGILKGMYRFRKSDKNAATKKAHLLGSGAILNEAVKAADILEDKYDVSADVWSVTSYKELYRDAMDTERENMLNSNGKSKQPYIGKLLSNEKGVFVAASDYVKTLPASIAKWIPGRTVTLGTDGFGRSDSRAALRDFFEVDYRFIALGALYALSQDGKIDAEIMHKAIEDLEIDPDKPNPVFS